MMVHLDRFPSIPSSKVKLWGRKANIAKRLSGMTNGEVKVSFVPGAYDEFDDRSRGHLFRAHLSNAAEMTEFFVDDRKGDIAVQLAEQLRIIADTCHQLANVYDPRPLPCLCD